MGRQVTIYGINLQLISSQLSFIYDGIDLLQIYAQDEAKPSPANLNQTLRNKPANLTADECELLIAAFNDFRELTPINFAYDARLNEMRDVGIRELFAFSATNPSSVFMACLHQFIEEGLGSVIHASEYNYLLDANVATPFFDFLCQLTQYFRSQEDADSMNLGIYQEIEMTKRELCTQIYVEQSKYRAADQENYEAKWGTDYFNFAWYLETFVAIRKDIKSYDRILIADSY